MSKRYLGKKELEYLVRGSSFFGGGGGGSAVEGMELLKKIPADAKVEMIDVDDMEEGTVATMVAALGSPVATKGKLFEEEAKNAVLGMKKEAEKLGENLKYIYSGEQGGGNTMLPVYTAYVLGMPIIDTDGNGRAVPEMNTGLEPIYGIPTSPVILASKNGDTIVGTTADPMDSVACENIARHMCQIYDQGIGFASWKMNKEQLKKASAIGQMSKTIEVGKLMAENDLPDFVRGMSKLLGDGEFECLANGTITDIHMNTGGGFDSGFTTIKLDEKRSCRVLFENENLVAYDPEGKAAATVPSIISITKRDENGKTIALSNSETVVGMDVVLTVTKADPRWYAIPAGYDCWNEVLIGAGYVQSGPQVK